MVHQPVLFVVDLMGLPVLEPQIDQGPALALESLTDQMLDLALVNLVAQGLELALVNPTVLDDGVAHPVDLLAYHVGAVHQDQAWVPFAPVPSVLYLEDHPFLHLDEVPCDHQV